MLLFCSPICASLPAAKTLLPPLIQRARRRRKPPFSLLCPVLFFCPLFIGRRGGKGKEGKSVLPPPPSLSSSGGGGLQGSISYYVGESLARDRLSPDEARKKVGKSPPPPPPPSYPERLVSAALPPPFSFSLRRPPSPSLRFFYTDNNASSLFPFF